MICTVVMRFLSSNAQDFIEEIDAVEILDQTVTFLSSNAQDFIEESDPSIWGPCMSPIPEQ